MSTKIYNGFRMKNLPATELVGFINELREKIRPQINEVFCKGVVQICTKLITQALKYNDGFDPYKVDELEQKFLRSWYAASLNGPTAVQKALYPIDKIVEDLDYPFIGDILNLAVNVYRNDTLNETIMSCYNDIRSNIAFLKGRDNEHLLFITYGNVFVDHMFELIKNKDELITKYGIEEYGYWNNTDPPEGITDEEWKKIGDDWNVALPGAGIASRCGLCTSEIIDPEVLFSIFKMSEDGRTKRIIELMPSINEIAEIAARKETLRVFISADERVKDESVKDLTGLHAEYSEKLKSDQEMLAHKNAYAERITKILSEQKNLLSATILDLLPNYMKWRKEK